MKDTVFWNDEDKISLAFVNRLQESGVLKYVQFTSFVVNNPKQQDAGVNKLLQILEIDVLPTIFVQGQSFHGAGAFEWLDFQINSLREQPDKAPQQPHVSQPPPSLQQLDAADEALSYTEFGAGNTKGPDAFGDNPFNNRTSLSKGGISDAAVEAAQNMRDSQVPIVAPRH